MGIISDTLLFLRIFLFLLRKITFSIFFFLNPSTRSNPSLNGHHLALSHSLIPHYLTHRLLHFNYPSNSTLTTHFQFKLLQMSPVSNQIVAHSSSLFNSYANCCWYCCCSSNLHYVVYSSRAKLTENNYVT